MAPIFLIHCNFVSNLLLEFNIFFKNTLEAINCLVAFTILLKFYPPSSYSVLISSWNFFILKLLLSKFIILFTYFSVN